MAVLKKNKRNIHESLSTVSHGLIDEISQVICDKVDFIFILGCRKKNGVWFSESQKSSNQRKVSLVFQEGENSSCTNSRKKDSAPESFLSL